MQYPPPTGPPVAHIAAPITDGIRCNQCPYVCRRVQTIQDHCRKAHGWVNSHKRGGDMRKKAREEREVPWTTGITCQRFCVSRSGKRWFEVGREGAAAGSTQPAGESPAERAASSIQQLRLSQAERVKASHDELIRVTSERLEPNPWLHRVGWAVHLQGLNLSQLRATTGPIQEDEGVLDAMWSTLNTVLDQARGTCSPNTVGHAVLFEVQRKEADVKPVRPFDNRLEDDTWARYKDVWRVLLCVWHRTQEMDDEKRPPYRLTVEQGELWDRFEEAVGTGTSITTQDKAERAGLDMLVGMLDHQLKRGHYENALVSALAVMGINEEGGWVDIKDFTTKFSAVIKVARMLVVHQAVVEQRDEVATLEMEMGREEAEDRVVSLFQRVRAKVQRFMTRTSGDKEAEPTPMDWIIETRTYGMHIQYNTAVAGVIDWVGERVSYRRARFTIGQLSDALHELVRESRGLLAELTMLVAPDEGFGVLRPDGHEMDLAAQLPPIPWSSIEDDHSETKVGYSFLSDDRNEWVGKADGWVFRRLTDCAEARRRWGLEGSRGGASPFDERAVRDYGHTFEQLRERLWMLLHMLGGQPGRATEIGGLRMVNTANGGVRNIFSHDKMMCFVTAYHKGYRTTGQAKVVHRYLPREVGELLVWYMWLVLPFWQEVQGISRQVGRYSAFLWADETVQGDVAGADKPGTVTVEEAGEGADGASTADEEAATGEWTWRDERVWTTDKARRIMQRHSTRLLGSRLNVSMWRHVAIAIANRYLNEAFGRQAEDGLADENDDDELEDSPWDLQAGHGTRLAGMIYARELMQFGSGLAAKRQKFRKVSRQWHRFLGFGAEDSGYMVAGRKRKMEAHDNLRLQARARRFEKLRLVNMAGQLRQMTGDDKAEFRGNQKEVLKAIVDGHSPILQIMGTGGGKSLSFMLPAYCSPDGVTVVVTPLVALRTDMHA
ncbi:hypothetical protein CMUS01_14418, partial [Colletotrichum musicola]